MSVFDKARIGGAVECTEHDYDEALGAVPPEYYLRRGFVMGEPYDFDRWYAFWGFEGKFWCMLTTIDDARSVTHIDSNGVTYSAAKNYTH